MPLSHAARSGTLQHAGFDRSARLVVDDEVDAAADGVVRQRRHVQRLIHHACTERTHHFKQALPPSYLLENMP